MWQPIETAPKDGTPVDLWCLGQFSQGRICDCWFYENRWWQYSETGDEWCRAEVHDATHWMPIPQGPADKLASLMERMTTLTVGMTVDINQVIDGPVKL